MLDRILIGASSTETTDPNFKNVTLLLHGDGSNGAQNNTFIDSSTNNFTITRNGNTTQGSFSPYGSNWSNYFDGSGDYLTVPDNAALQMDGSDFTYEAWIYPTGAPNTYNSIFYKRGTTGNYAGVGISIKSNGKFSVLVASGSSTWGIVDEASASFTLNTWQHIAAVRSGSNFSFYVNGVRAISTSIAFNVYDGGAAQAIGDGSAAGGQPFLGYISNARIVKGTAVYSGASFTPPTAPLTAITNTSLLTCAYNRFRDGSANNFTITRNGDVKVTNFAPFAPSSAYSTTTNGGSAYFDGTGDYLSVADNTALEFGSGDFTIEMWAYFVATGGSGRGLIAKGTTTGGSFLIFQGGTNELAFYASSNGSTWDISGGNQFSSNITLNTWHHIAVTRSGTTFRLFLNGDLITSFTSSASLVNNSSSVDIGTYGSLPFNGYLSNVRLVKGTAVYTAAFTPPTSPVTAITNTQLLTNFTNAAIFDNSMKNDLETVGNAQISTSVKKFGTGSMYFDGSGDWLAIPDSTELQMGTGIFTIEFWWYPVSLSGTQCLFEKGYTISRQLALITGNGDGLINVYTSSPTFTASTAVTANTWNHIALVRNSGTLTLYLNGTSVASASNSTNFANSAPVAIGANITGGGGAGAYPVNGYIDEFRITKGVARYTANFTAPTAPFPNK